MLSDSLRSLPVFDKARKRFDARDSELLRKGVDVSLTSPAPSGSFKAVFVLLIYPNAYKVIRLLRRAG